jgi:hypothetical protein
MLNKLIKVDFKMKFLSFDAYTLKWIAIIGMIANHVAIGLNPVLPFGALAILYAAGGVTYPIMSYFVVEGYRYTSNLKKYISRLLIFGIIAQAFHPMVLGATSLIIPGFILNIMFTIALSLVVLILYDKIKIRFLFWVSFVFACILAMFMDWYFLGILMPLMYYTIKKENRRRLLPGIVTGVIWLLFSLFGLSGVLAAMHTPGMEAMAEDMLSKFSLDLWIAMCTFIIGCILGAILIRNFNGSRGKSAKWLFYIAYPVHLAIIAGIAVALGITGFSLFGL